MTIKERYSNILQRFEETMPDPRTELIYDNPWQLLISVILSAQCTDKRINMITPALFARFPGSAELAQAKEEDVKELISSVTYPNQKTRAIIKTAQTIEKKFGGIIPKDIDSLMELPGVGRKTANVMLAVLWNEAAMPVDTHVFRVSNRIGLTRNSKTPVSTEKTLCKHIAPELLPKAHHWLILHGRYICKARKPDCDNCVIAEYCKSFKKI